METATPVNFGENFAKLLKDHSPPLFFTFLKPFLKISLAHEGNTLGSKFNPA